MSPGSAWQNVRLPSNWVGGELTIELVGYYDYYAGELLSVEIGTKAGFLYDIVEGALPILIPSFTTLLCGLIMLAVSLFFHDQAGKRLRYLGLFTATTAAWILLEAHITQLFSGDILLNMNLVFILFSLVPVFNACYLLTYSEFEKSRYIRFMLVASSINCIVLHALRFLGLVDYLISILSVHLMLLLTMWGILKVYIRGKREGHKLNRESRMLFTALLVFSIFGLKWINDNLGHKAGDQALVIVANLLEKYFCNCYCYRIGGDEFCVLSEQYTEQEFAAVAEEFTQAVSAQKIGEGHSLSISCGYVRENGWAVDQTLVKADAEMYEKKMAYRSQHGIG